MCGIILKINNGKGKDHVNRDILEQFEDQRSRGTQGFGSIFINEKGEIIIKRATSDILAVMDLYHTPSKAIMFHHRAPSSSRNKISQAHPIKITDASLKHDYYFMHNGIVSNHEERKKEHDDMGWQYTTEVEDDTYTKKETMCNDSETLGIDIARFIEGEEKHITACGSAAFFMLQVDKETAKAKRIFFGRNEGNPLKLAKTRGEIMLSSEGKGEDVNQDTLYSFDPLSADMKLDKKPMVIKRLQEKTVYYSGQKTTNTIGFTDDDDYSYNKDIPSSHSSWKAAGKTYTIDDELEEICEEHEESAIEAVTEFFDAITAEGEHGMFTIDVTDALKEIGRQMLEAQEKTKGVWSKRLADELDEEYKNKLEKEDSPVTAVPEKLSAR